MRRYLRCARYAVFVLLLYAIIAWSVRDNTSGRIPNDDSGSGVVHNVTHLLHERTRIVAENNISDTKNNGSSFRSGAIRSPLNGTIHSNHTHNSSKSNYQQTKAPIKETYMDSQEEQVNFKDLPPGERPMLCIFTTFRHGRPFGDTIHKRTLRNWASLSPYIVPYLFVNSNDSDWTAKANRYHWKTLVIQQYENGLPVLKHMFTTLEEYTNPFFIGFANDDILFDDSLLDSLNYLKKSVRNLDHRDLLLTGKRKDYIISSNSPSDIGTGGDISKVGRLAKSLPLSGPDALEYVIFSNQGFKWEEFPSLVVGAVGLTNWIVAHAVMWNYIVMELTSSLRIVHQTDVKDRQGWNRNGNFTTDTNVRIYTKLDKTFENTLERGITTCLQFITICRKWEGRSETSGCNFALAKRKRMPRGCKPGQEGALHHQHGLGRHEGHKRHASPEDIDTFEGEMQQLSWI